MTTTARCPRCAHRVETESRSTGRYFATHRAEPGGVTCSGSGDRARARSVPRSERTGVVTDQVLADFADLARRAARVKERKAAQAAKEARDRWRG